MSRSGKKKGEGLGRAILKERNRGKRSRGAGSWVSLAAALAIKTASVWLRKTQSLYVHVLKAVHKLVRVCVVCTATQ